MNENIKRTLELATNVVIIILLLGMAIHKIDVRQYLLSVVYFVFAFFFALTTPTPKT